MSDEEAKAGSPLWMATFADLMSLLMCFFVLLLSFSEMDAEKYKQIAGSMASAFGVQNQVEASGIPLGTSIIAQEFSAGRPTPTPDNVVQQETRDSTQMTLDSGLANTEGDLGSGQVDEEAARELLETKLEELRAETEADAEILEEVLRKEIEDDMIDIESGFRAITIRIRERGSFSSGSANLNEDFIDVMTKLREVLEDVDGRIAVEGHTDNIPIARDEIPSNWHLSAQRALSVAYELFKQDGIQDDRFMIVGYADTKPFSTNDTPEGRAQNRRVEIVIHQDLDEEVTEELKALDMVDDTFLDTLTVE